MIELNQVSVRRDGRLLFKDATFQLHPKHKIGLTGNNGTGKSTLFAVLLGTLEVDTGDISIPANWKKGHMAQEVDSVEMSAIDYVLEGDDEWFELNKKLDILACPEKFESISEDEIAHIYQRFEEIDGYRTPTKAAQIMAGLGFSEPQHELLVGSFSGGWRMRLNLARTLMCRADVLLLDEPTNHLDLDAIIWLEDWIVNFDGMVLLISHDQSFLDACVGHILHVENQGVTLYTGNYSQFITVRGERLAQQQQAFEKQEETKAHLEDFIRRFRAKASKAKQAQSRIKQLERMSELSGVMADNPFSFKFYPPSHMASPLIQLGGSRDSSKGSPKGAEIGYGDTVLLKDVKLQVTPDTRLGLLGMNGAGKSTVIKALVGDLPLLTGEYEASDTLKIGYFNQHQMDSLDNEATPLAMMRRLAGKTHDGQLRSFLGSFDFRGDRIDTPCKLFSGGERARLTLALIVWQRPNVLVLDEPTNHLDLQMRQALTIALQGFEGAVVLVSHDRELIANVCDELFLVHDGVVDEYSGDIADYGKWIKEVRKQNTKAENAQHKENKAKKMAQVEAEKEEAEEKARKEAESNNSNSTLTKDEVRKLKAEQRNATAPIRKSIEKAEKELKKISEQLTSLEEQLADTGLYDEGRKSELMALLDEQKTLQQNEAKFEEALMEAMEELERVEGEFGV